MNKFLIPFSIIVAGIIIAGAILFSGSNFTWPGMMGSLSSKKTDSSTLFSPPAQTPPVRPLNIDLGTNPIQGSESAKISVVEFGDYQCPYCGQFHANILSRLRTDFINKGLVKFAFRDLAFLGPESLDAALASRCANDEDKFWAFHDILYSNQKGENQGAFSLANLKKFARQLGLNAGKFSSCLTERKYDHEVRDDVSVAQTYRVNSTPTLFIDSKPVPDWRNYSQLKSQIESALLK